MARLSLLPLSRFRMNRRAFWGCFLLLAAVTAGTAKLYPWLLNGGFAWPWIFLHSARLHDFGRSGLWACWVVVAVLGAFVALATLRPPTSLYGPLAIAVFGAIAAFTLWAGLRRGDLAENRFGRAPPRWGFVWSVGNPSPSA